MIRTLIYGSCVSRDTFDFLDPSKFSLFRYVARQSLISAFTPVPRAEMPTVDIPSAFQRRMVEGDWDGSLPREVIALQDCVDLVLWDVFDERHGVRKVGTDPVTFVTRSVESISSGLDQRLSHLPLWGLGDADHRQIFDNRLGDWVRLLDEAGLLAKTALVAPPWAAATDDGRHSPKSFHWSAETANHALADYYDLIRSHLDIPVVSLPESEAVAASDHKWGVAPFHYVPSAYASMADQIATFA